MMKLTHEFVKNYIESFDGYKLLCREYKGSLEKMNILCPCGNIFSMSYSAFKQGHRCPKHRYEKISKKLKTPFSEIKLFVEKNGYELLSNEVDYENARSYLDIRCKNGHQRSVMWISFKKNIGCFECNIKNRRHTHNHIKEYIEKEGYELLSVDYKNAFDKLKLKCPKGHIFEMRYNSFQQGQRCPVHVYENGCSKPEKEILNYVKNIYDGTIIQNDRSIIQNYWTGHFLELDIFLPDVNKAIEYNAKYWHENDYSRWKDEMKFKQCTEKGIDLFIVDHNQWIKNKDFSTIKEFIYDNG